MDERQKRQIMAQQATLTSEYLLEKKKTEGLFDALITEKKYCYNELECVYQGHIAALKNIAGDDTDDSQFMYRLNQVNEQLDFKIKQTQWAIESYIVAQDKAYRQQLNYFEDQIARQ